MICSSSSFSLVIAGAAAVVVVDDEEDDGAAEGIICPAAGESGVDFDVGGTELEAEGGDDSAEED